jgi:hypothetical protein
MTRTISPVSHETRAAAMPTKLSDLDIYDRLRQHIGIKIRLAYRKAR